MGYQPRTRTPRDFGKRSAKTSSKPKPGRHREARSHRLEETHVPTSKEIVERTLNSLSILGNQRFAVAPFHEHFDRWLLSLRTVISEFGSNPVIAADDELAKETSKVFSDAVEALKNKRLKEASREEALRRINKDLMDQRSLLAQIEREYAAKSKELASRKEQTVKPVASRAAKIRRELNRVVKLRAGFFRGISKKAKALKQAEATHKLESTRSELAELERSFVTEQSRLQDEYAKRKRHVVQAIANHEKEIESLEAGVEIDDALDVRRAACDALIKSLNAFVLRNQQTSKSSNLSS